MINPKVIALKLRATTLSLLLVSAVASSHAQLSSPLGQGQVPTGTGAGHFSANSAFAPMEARADVVPWSVLTNVKTKVEKTAVVPVYPSTITALDQKSQRIQGYMMPLDPGEKQKHFLLSSVPLTCPFCLPGGPESMVEIKTKSPVKYSMEVVVIEGLFAVLKNDPTGLYYRMTDAVATK
jgi:hypothetical protein